MKASLLILGAGGHARVLLTAVAPPSVVRGYLAPEPAPEPWPETIAYMGPDEALNALDPAQWQLVNGVGAIRPQGTRRQLFEAAKRLGYEFASLVHPSATIETRVPLGEGAQVMAGATVQCGVEIGANAIVNTGAVVDHDCRLGAHVHIAPGVCLAGGVTVEAGAHVGIGATVLQNVRIGARALIGAGAVVLADVATDEVVVGIPARPVPPQRATP